MQQASVHTWMVITVWMSPNSAKHGYMHVNHGTRYTIHCKNQFHSCVALRTSSPRTKQTPNANSLHGCWAGSKQDPYCWQSHHHRMAPHPVMFSLCRSSWGIGFTCASDAPMPAKFRKTSSVTITYTLCSKSSLPTMRTLDFCRIEKTRIQWGGHLHYYVEYMELAQSVCIPSLPAMRTLDFCRIEKTWIQWGGHLHYYLEYMELAQSVCIPSGRRTSFCCGLNYPRRDSLS
jgi:hypothetical protein